MRLRRGNGDESGQVLVIGLVCAIGLAIMSLTVANVGIMIAEKIHVQDTVDAAAYSAAVSEARYMNLTAYLNRAMIANYDQMAFNTALWASMTAYDHGIAPILTVGYLIGFVVQAIPIVQAAAPVIDKAIEALDKTVHAFTHAAGKGLGKVFGQDKEYFDQQDFNKILEIYVTDVLSTYQGLTYVATQAARHRVIQEVAKEMDPNVVTTTVMGLGAEALSADELKRATDWIIKDPDKRLSGMGMVNEAYDRTMGTDEEIHEAPDDGYDREPTLDDDDKLTMLGALTEASLDKFAAGRDREGHQNQLRAFNFGDLIPEAFKIIFIPAMVADCIADCITFWDGCSCDFDPHVVIGATLRDRNEDCFSQPHVPVIARQRFREVNFFGVEMDLPGISGALQALVNLLTDPDRDVPMSVGYTSGQNKTDMANIDNMIEPNDFDQDRFLQCLFGGCTDNSLNVLMSVVTLSAAAAAGSQKDKIDDHWDGSFDAKPTCAILRASPGTPCYDETANYISDVAEAGALSDGVPKYDLRTDLDIVGWTQYHYDETDAPSREGDIDNNLLAGPTVAVVGVKPADKIHGLRGLGIGNTYPITALARGQVYYLRNPKRPDERPNLFNPYWVARLAPIDSPETPKLLSEGLPFVATLGAPASPTH